MYVNVAKVKQNSGTPSIPLERLWTQNVTLLLCSLPFLATGSFAEADSTNTVFVLNNRTNLRRASTQVVLFALYIFASNVCCCLFVVCCCLWTLYWIIKKGICTLTLVSNSLPTHTSREHWVTYFQIFVLGTEINVCHWGSLQSPDPWRIQSNATDLQNPLGSHTEGGGTQKPAWALPPEQCERIEIKGSIGTLVTLSSGSSFILVDRETLIALANANLSFLSISTKTKNHTGSRK